MDDKSSAHSSAAPASAPLAGGDCSNVWGTLTRKMHTYWLSQPSGRRLMPFPDPAVYIDLPRPITLASLKYEPTKRIKVMSSARKDRVRTKYVKPVAKENVVEPAALLAVATPHLIELAKPNTRDISRAKSRKKDSKKKKSKRIRDEKRLKRSLDAREGWLAKNATARQWPPPEHKHPIKRRFVLRGKKKLYFKEKTKFTIPKRSFNITKSEVFKRAVFLSIPKKRRNRFVWVHEKDDFVKRRQAKLAEPVSETIRKLARPKPIPEEAMLDIKYKPFKINKGALRYKATERITALAVAVQKTARVDSNVKENPFGVLKRALKAICSKRVKFLAQPITRE